MSDRVALAVMARAPSDARGKTRLLKTIGVEDGTDLRWALLLDTLEVARCVPGVDRVLLCSPESSGAEIAARAGGAFRILPQRGDDLGARMEHAFADVFALGYSAVAIMGSDLPTLPPGHLEEGIVALRREVDPVVLGPSLDGGYYLVGLRMRHPEIFRGIPWSTPDVLAATLSAAEANRLSVTLLPSWYDIDSADDLRRVLERPAGPAPEPGRTHAWLVGDSAPARRLREQGDLRQGGEF